eukprot:m.306382 g.306382  ORF g.306382 m.306382 type:complete len:429 (+) comp41202_c0_seq1:96-1382(+)
MYRPEIRLLQERFERRNKKDESTRRVRTDRSLDSGLPQSIQTDSAHSSMIKEVSTSNSFSVEKVDSKGEERTAARLIPCEIDEGIVSMSMNVVLSCPPADNKSLSDVDEGEEEDGDLIAEDFRPIVEPQEPFYDDSANFTNGQSTAHYFAITEDARYFLASAFPFLVAKDDEGDTPLHTAIIHNKPKVLSEIMDALGWYLPACVNMRNKLGQTPLHLAATLKQSYVVRALMDGGAQVDLEDWRGNTPLHLACRQADVRSLVEMLKPIPEPGMTKSCLPFEKDDLSKRNFDGFAPIHLAVLSQSAECVRCLCIAGANVDIEDGKSGRRAIHHAVELDNLLLITTLIYDCNADVDAVSFDGATALHSAAGRGLRATTALLVASGADVAVRNYEGDSPFDIAIGEEIHCLCKPINQEMRRVVSGMSEMDIV